MARTMEPHSASAQFFINASNNSFLNHSGKTVQGWGYAVFGKVTGHRRCRRHRKSRHRFQGWPPGRTERRRDHRESRDH
jgi:cyclophilin family peptidyl-prolyl cis-trans isomerase